MKKLWKLFRTKPLLRPTVYLSVFEAVIVLLLALLWERFLDQGERGLGFALGAFGLILLMLSWFQYLRLDGVRPIEMLKKNREPKEKKTKVRTYDMADFLDEPISVYRDLEPEERICCQLVSCAATGLIFFLLSIFL